MHPTDLGAHVCCDSAHKTLPVLTGGAYLHLSENAPTVFLEQAKNAMALFGSTSPSYLILQSLDLANEYLSNGYSRILTEFIAKVDRLKDTIREAGYTLYGNEPLKLTICTKPYGYIGEEFALELRKNGIEIEFFDKDFAVMMLTPSLNDNELEALTAALLNVRRLASISEIPPEIPELTRVISPREALFSESETLSASKCAGRILASANIICPPAVPIALCGERIDQRTVKAFEYYGVDSVRVIKEK
jgi:arginine/lysine/ornithine decarboxylase